MAAQDPWEYSQQPMYPGSPYPATSIANALANIVNTWSAKKQKDAYTQALAQALQPQPVDRVGITPPITEVGQVQQRQAMGAYDQPTEQDLLSKLLASPNQDLAAQAAPMAIQSQLATQVRANQPITPYERANLGRQEETAKAQREATAANLQANREDRSFQAEQQRQFVGAQGDLNRANTRAIADARVNSAGLFGRGLSGRAYDILRKGLEDDAYRSTPEYITAWQIASDPKVDPATGTVVVPDLSAFKPPVTSGGIQQPQNQPQAVQGQPQGGAAPGPSAQRMPSIQSFAPPNPNQAEAASASYANRLSASNDILNNPKIEEAGASLGQRLKSEVPGGVGNFIVAPEYQQFDQAARNFINAQLRRESGAVISEEEFANARKQYLAQPGDSPQVRAQKKIARDMAVKNMQLSAGNVLMPPGTIQQSSPAKGAPVVPMAQGFGAQPQQVGGPNPQEIVDELRRRGVIK